MIKLKKVTLHNFLSYKDAELPLENQGLTLISGINNSSNNYVSNGSGKTSLLNSITYAIYGQTIDGLSGDAVINKEVGTACSVILDFYVGSTSYQIQRYRKGKHNNRNKLKLLANGSEVTLATNAKTQVEIDKIFSIPFDTYVNTVVYGQGNIPVFSQATDKGKKEILESLANTSVYAKARDISSSKEREHQSTLATLKREKDLKTSQLEQTRGYQQRAQEKYKQDLAYQETLESMIVKTSRKLSSENAELEKLNNDLEQAQEDAKENHLELPSGVPDISSYEQKLANLTYVVTDGKSKIKDYFKQYKDLDIQKVCPTCGQPVTNQHKEQEREKLTDLIKNASKQLADNIKSLKELQPIVEKKRNEVASLSSRSQEIYKHNQLLDSKVDKISYSIKEKNNEISSLNSTLTLYKQQKDKELTVQDFSKDIKALEESLDSLDIQLKSEEKKVEDYGILANKVFSRQGIQSMAMDLIIPYLNEHTNYYLAKLSGSVIQVYMSTQTLNANNTLADKFDLQVKNASGADSYQSCSAGEKKRIDIAISFAIQDLLNSNSETGINIAIYDECFDGLDAVGTEKVIEIMQEKQKKIGTVFVITHNELLKPLFENVITVEKDKNGISRIVK
jgi:DNA repair exonuclease SbcCD ATPase subunit